MAGFGSADDLDALVEEVDMPPRKRIQRCLQTKSTEDQRCLQRTMAEALEPWKKIVTSQDEIVTSQKKVVRLLEDDNTRLLLELARHTGVYATRPLIEYGLNEYAVKNDVKEWTTTALSKTFIQHCLFKPAPDDTELQDWGTEEGEQNQQGFQMDSQLGSFLRNRIVGHVQRFVQETSWAGWYRRRAWFYDYSSKPLGSCCCGCGRMCSSRPGLFRGLQNLWD